MSPENRSVRRNVVSLRAARAAALVAAAALSGATLAHAQPAGGGAERADSATADDEIVVLGRIGQLRERIRIAEEAVFLRFNDINSDDRFDIHCRWDTVTGSRIAQRSCVSNDWREQSGRFADSQLRLMRGESADSPDAYLAAQAQGQRELAREMRRLAVTDPQLERAVLELGQAQRALEEEVRSPADATAWREVPPGEYELPFPVARVLEVRIGRQDWVHALANPTFTFGSVTGAIRGLFLDCADGRERLEYQADVDWTVPASRRECALVVAAKRNTTFVLYELE